MEGKINETVMRQMEDRENNAKYIKQQSKEREGELDRKQEFQEGGEESEKWMI